MPHARELGPHRTAARPRGWSSFPWKPLDSGELLHPGHPLAAVAERLGVPTPALAVAWLLDRSLAMLPIPGTSSVDHLVDNLRAATVMLSDDDRSEIERLAT